MKRTFKRILCCTLCMLLLLSLMPAWALSVSDDSDETDQAVIDSGAVPEGECLISEGTLEFASQSASSNGIYINFVAASNGTVGIDLLEMDHDYHVIVYENDWWLTSFNGTDVPDSIEFPVQADGQYKVIFSVVDYHTETLDAWLPVAGFLTYRMTSDVPVGDIVRWPHEDPRQILEDAYALEDGRYLPYGATLTGEITAVKTPYDSYYQNITVVMEVSGCEEMPIVCYRLAGEGADTLTIGDTITVSGTISNYYGTIEFEQGCTLDSVIKGENEIPVPPEDPRELVDAAYALKEGENLPYTAVLTGKVVSIDTHYDENYRNITVTILVPGRGDKPIVCYRLKGQGVDTLAAGDVITVSGILANYHGTIEFKQGCTLIAKSSGPDSLAIVGEGIPGVEIWDPADPAGDMTEVAPYFYQLTLECPANTLMRFKFAGNDMWDDEWNFGSARVVLGSQVDLLCGPGTADMTLQVDEACTLLFTVDLYPMLYGGNAMLQVNRVDPIGQPRPLVVHVPSSWTRVYAYTWEPDSFGDFPGRELQKQDGYYWEAIRSNMENLVLTGLKADGSYQYTNDIYLRPGDDTVTVTVYDDGTYDVDYSGNPDPWGPDSLTLAGSGLPGITEWNPMDAAGDMTEIANNVYQKILDFTAGTTICFRFVADHDWFSGHLGGGSIVLGQTTPLDFTSGSQDLQLVIPEACQLKFTVDLNPMRNGGNATLLVEKIDEPASTRKLTVYAPDSWQYVNAYTWYPEAFGLWPGARMQKNGDCYQASISGTMTNLVINGTMADGVMAMTPDITLQTNGLDVIVYIEEDGSCTVEYEGNPAHARSLAVVVPSASWNNVFVYTWQPESFGAYPGKKLEGNEGVIYREIISSQLENLVISGTFADGSSWHTDDIHLEPGVRPVTVMLRDDFTYTIIYDNNPSDGDTYRVVGSAAWMGLWDAASNAGLMEETSDGVYQKRFENVKPGDYEFKITRNGKWDDSIGQLDGSNFTFAVSQVSDVIVTCIFDTGDALVSVQIVPLSVGDVTGDGQVNLGDVARLYAHSRGTRLLTDATALRYADFNGDGKVNIGDVASIYTYVRWYTLTSPENVLP